MYPRRKFPDQNVADRHVSENLQIGMAFIVARESGNVSGKSPHIGGDELEKKA